MSSTTPYLGLTLYDSTTDQAVAFATFRAVWGGPATSSNFYKIDTGLFDLDARIDILESYRGAIPVAANYISANYYEASGVTAITAYTSGMTIILSLDTTSSGTVTLNINALGTKSLMKIDSAGTPINLTGSDLVKNRRALFVYDGARWLWVSANSADQISIVGTVGNIVTVGTDNTLLGTTAMLVKASGAELDTGTDDIKFATAKAIADSAVTTATKSQTLSNKTLSTTQLGEASLKLDAALSADGTWSGITEIGTAGAALAFGDLCFFQTSDSRWELANTNSYYVAGHDKKLGMCVLAAAGDGSATEMLLVGKIRADGKFPTLTIGAPVYMGETDGTIVVARPLVNIYVYNRVIGYGNTADELYFNPEPLMSKRFQSEIVLRRTSGSGFGAVSETSATWHWLTATTANTAKLWTPYWGSTGIVYARFVAVWNPNATGAPVSGIRLVKFDDGPTNIEAISTFEVGSYVTPRVDSEDVSAAFRAIIAEANPNGKQIGYQVHGDGSAGCYTYAAVVEIVWG